MTVIAAELVKHTTYCNECKGGGALDTSCALLLLSLHWSCSFCCCAFLFLVVMVEVEGQGGGGGGEDGGEYAGQR